MNRLIVFLGALLFCGCSAVPIDSDSSWNLVSTAKEAVFHQPEVKHLDDEMDRAPQLKDKSAQRYVSQIEARLLKLSSLG